MQDATTIPIGLYLLKYCHRNIVLHRETLDERILNVRYVILGPLDFLSKFTVVRARVPISAIKSSSVVARRVIFGWTNGTRALSMHVRT